MEQSLSASLEGSSAGQGVSGISAQEKEISRAIHARDVPWEGSACPAHALLKARNVSMGLPGSEQLCSTVQREMGTGEPGSIHGASASCICVPTAEMMGLSSWHGQC